MIHQITKAFDDRDEHGIDCNIWMKLYEASENYDRDDNIYQGVIANGFSFNSAMSVITLFRGATMLENPPRGASVNYSTRIDDLEVWITLNDIKEAVEDFDDDSREELIEHLKECLVKYPKEIPCDEYQTTIDDADVEVEVDEDELMDQKGDEIMAIAQKDKIIIEAPNMAIEIELEEALRAIFNKHGLKPEDHMWGI